jgi:hypothetical protein
MNDRSVMLGSFHIQQEILFIDVHAWEWALFEFGAWCSVPKIYPVVSRGI